MKSKEGVIAPCGHKGSLTNQAIIIELIRDKYGLLRSGIHGEVIALVLTKSQVLIETNVVVHQEGACKSGAPCKGTRILRRNESGIKSLVRNLPGAQAVLKPGITIVLGIAESAKGDDISTGAGKRLSDNQRSRWRQQVIRVDEPNDITRRMQQAKVPRSRRTAVLLVHNNKARINGLIHRKNLTGTIGRTVIHADDLNVFIVLPPNGIDALSKVPLDIVDGNDDAYLLHWCLN